MATTNHLHIEVVTRHKSLLGEGPVWDPKRRSISWVDILQGTIHEFVVSQNRHRNIYVYDMVGSVALCAEGNYIAALKSGLAFVNRDSGAIQRLHHPEVHLTGNRFNDGKCDPVGRFWVGTMALSEEAGAGNLYMIERDLSYIKKIEGVSISNGMAWSLDHKTFYYIDSPTFEVVAYDYDKQTGTIANKRVVITIPKTDGSPDGMTIDTEGMLWIAHWDGWQVARWNPITGAKLFQIPISVARITSCTFGGDSLQDLYITSARVGLKEDQLKEQPLAGSLFVVRNCGFRGVDTFEFDFEPIG